MALITIIVEVKNPDDSLNPAKRLFEGMALQKMYILYTNGQAVTAILNKDLTLDISSRFKLDYDPCGYFGYFDQSINIYAASNKNVSYITRNLKSFKFVGDKLPHYPFTFEMDSSQVRISDQFWIIGNVLET